MRSGNLLISSLLIAVLCFSGAISQETGSFNVTIDFAGENRTLSMYVPTDYDESTEYQLLVGLHGMGDNSENYRNSLMSYLNWNTVFANTIFVFPDGGSDRSRDFYTPEGDQQIITKAIEYAEDNYTIAEKQIIVQGFSLGGRSALKYGLENYGNLKGLLLHTPAMQGLKDPINISPYSLIYDYENASELPIVITHGGQDLLYINSIRSLVEQLVLNDCPLLYNYYQNMGHSIPGTAATEEHIAFLDSPGSDDLKVEWVDVIMPERTCSDFISPECRVRNVSNNDVLSIEFEYISPVETKTYTWQTPTSGIRPFEHLDVELPEIEIKEGFNTITVSISKINGEDFNSTEKDFEFEIEMINQAMQLPLNEGFEEQESLMHWYIDASYHWATWGLDSDVKRSGNYSVAMYNTILLTNNRGVPEDMLAPFVDLTTAEEPELSFDLAFNYHFYTPPLVSSDLMLTDTLEILISTDCGETFTSIYRKWGEDLATADEPILNPQDLQEIFFIPNNDEWRRESISLEDFKDASKATFIFRYISGLGGSINIDNVRIGEEEIISVSEPSESPFVIYPNPAKDNIRISFDQKGSSSAQIQLYDIMGRMILDHNRVEHAPGINDMNIDLSDVPPGIYYLNAYIDNKEYTERLVIMK